jgi:hypothetical protein
LQNGFNFFDPFLQSRPVVDTSVYNRSKAPVSMRFVDLIFENEMDFLESFFGNRVDFYTRFRFGRSFRSRSSSRPGAAPGGSKSQPGGDPGGSRNRLWSAPGGPRNRLWSAPGGSRSRPWSAPGGARSRPWGVPRGSKSRAGGGLGSRPRTAPVAKRGAVLCGKACKKECTQHLLAGAWHCTFRRYAPYFPSVLSLPLAAAKGG